MQSFTTNCILLILSRVIYTDTAAVDNEKRKYPNVKTADFKHLVLNYKNFVDKSLLIKDFLNEDNDILITRPQGWGKTMNLNMLKRFFQIQVDSNGVPLKKNSNRILFQGGYYREGSHNETRFLKGLKIMKFYPEMVQLYQGKFPVIYFTFKDLFRKNYEEMTERISDEIRKLYKEFYFLKKYCYADSPVQFDEQKLKQYMEGSKKIDAERGMTLLIEALRAHFGTQVFVFIDDYDEILTQAYLRFGSPFTNQYQDVRLLVKNILLGIFKDRSYIRGMITGITNIPLNEVSGGLNCIIESTMLDETFFNNFGFTSNEVNYLLASSPYKVSPRDVDYWYSGYLIDAKDVYNPSSVMRCLANKGDFGSYWAETRSLELIKKISISSNIKYELTQLLYSNTSITVDLERNIDFYSIEQREVFYTYLFFCGYFRAVPLNGYSYNLSIPNHEISVFMFENFLKTWIREEYSLENHYELGVVSAFKNYRMDRLEEEINKVLNVPSPLLRAFQEKKDEDFYNTLMVGLLFPLSSYFVMNSEYPTGGGKADIVLIPKTIFKSVQNAYIIEYKRAKSERGLSRESTIALHQIHNTSYDQNVKAFTYIKNIYKVGIAFFKNKSRVKYIVDPNPNYRQVRAS